MDILQTAGAVGGAIDVSACQAIHEVAVEFFAKTVAVDLRDPCYVRIGATVGGIAGLVEILNKSHAVLVAARPGLAAGEVLEFFVAEPVFLLSLECEGPLRDTDRA